MAFKVVDEPRFARDVVVHTPVDGGYRREVFSATFRALPIDQVKAFDFNAPDDVRQFLSQALATFSGLEDEVGDVLDYSDELRDRLLNIPFVRTALARTYFDAIGGASAGN